MKAANSLGRASLAGAFTFEPPFNLNSDLDAGDVDQIKRMSVFLQVVNVVRSREACWTPWALDWLGLSVDEARKIGLATPPPSE